MPENIESNELKECVIHSSAVKGKFMTSYRNNFNYHRVSLKFNQYENGKMIIDLSFTFEEILYLKYLICDDAKFMNDLFKRLINKKKLGNNNVEHQYQFKKGGISPERLAKKNQKRQDGKAEALNAYLLFGDKAMQQTNEFADAYSMMIIVTSGPGRIINNGLIAPDGKPDKTIYFPITVKELKTHLIAIESQVNAFLSKEFNENKLKTKLNYNNQNNISNDNSNNYTNNNQQNMNNGYYNNYPNYNNQY